ncbi:hypothetical protein GCM10023195_85140 [Actinoallomurus liliacearum]|uniref:Uncharacterized protein n=1 Tax=Actinoallomurus liliacearum TaxID=1080073 RepID=A0ABP8U1M2_9ACTN
MNARRFVFLDPDGMDDGWLYVVVEAPTGVFYQQQYGGTACRQGQLEGYLVPVFGPDALDALGELFVRHFRGAGTWNHRWSGDEVATLRPIVAGITFWACDGVNDHPHDLRLDDARIAEADEAWIPVRTPDGPGVLMWSNSD